MYVCGVANYWSATVFVFNECRIVDGYDEYKVTNFHVCFHENFKKLQFLQFSWEHWKIRAGNCETSNYLFWNFWKLQFFQHIGENWKIRAESYPNLVNLVSVYFGTTSCYKIGVDNKVRCLKYVHFETWKTQKSEIQKSNFK